MSIRRALTKEGKLIYVDTKTGEKYDYNPSKPLKNIVSGIISILLALMFYLLVSSYSPHRGFGEILIQSKAIKEPIYSIIIFIIAAIGLIGIVFLIIGIKNYSYHNHHSKTSN